MNDARERFLGDESDHEHVGPDGLLFTGDVISRLSRDQLTALGGFASRMFDVDMQQVYGIDESLSQARLAASEAEIRRPIPMTEEDFIAWASEQGYDNRLAKNSWDRIVFIAPSEPALEPMDEFPQIRFIESGGYHGVVDLWSVHDRLIGTEFISELWGRRTTDEHIRFLAELINDIMQLEEPLPTSREEWRFRQWQHRSY